PPHNLSKFRPATGRDFPVMHAISSASGAECSDRARPRGGASLIELLVVLCVIGIMVGRLLVALQGEGKRVHATECENKVRERAFGLSQALEAQQRLPAPGEWTVALLPYIEQRPLADAMKQHADPSGKYPRPQLMKCPMQNDFESR